MDRSSLQELLSQGLSLAEIGRRFELHESTVAYWVAKHGLEAANRTKHAAKGRLTREQLTPLVEAGMSIAEIAERVQRSKATVRHWLKHHGLHTAGGRGPRPREGVREADEAGLHETVLWCPRHGHNQHVREPRGYYRCKRCRAEAVVRRRRKVKGILVAEAGGRCALCGYDGYAGALEFHHLDPSTKRFGLSLHGLTPSIATLREEARKCVLLCSNCHAEVEGGIRSISG